jgi:hypothetical protein
LIASAPADFDYICAGDLAIRLMPSQPKCGVAFDPALALCLAGGAVLSK